eukprot:9351855-Alexandrium_andersonii.AAC.1
MGEPPGSGRAWLEAHSGNRLLAEAAARACGKAPSAAGGGAGHFDHDTAPYPSSPAALGPPG